MLSAKSILRALSPSRFVGKKAIRNNSTKTTLPEFSNFVRFSCSSQPADVQLGPIREKIKLAKDSLKNFCHNTFMTKPVNIMVAGNHFTTNLSNICGHGSFVMLAFGYMEHDVLLLRTYATSGIFLSILFQYYRPQPLWIPISWNSLFLAINCGMIAYILAERSDTYMPPDQAELYNRVFKQQGMSPGEFVQLMKLSEKKELKPGEPMAQAGGKQHHLYMISSGEADVVHDGEQVGHIKTQQFVGESPFLYYMNEDSTEDPVPSSKRENMANGNELASPLISHCDVSSGHNVGAVAYTWEFDKLRSYLKSHPHAAQTLQGSISADLTKKVDASWSPLERYRTIVQGTLLDGHVSIIEKEKLAHFRKKHHITMKDHDIVLDDLSWTKEEFERGYQQLEEDLVAYEKLLRNELKSGTLSQAGREKLRRYRVSVGLNLERHLIIVEKVGWTPDEFDAGSKDPLPCPKGKAENEAEPWKQIPCQV